MSKAILITEGWNDSKLTLLEQKHIIPFVSSIEKYITEAKLTPDQINQLFTSVEQGATAAGGNRSGIGKAVDVAKLPIEAVKFIDGKINELGKALQNSGPVKNIDQKFEQLKAKIGAKDSKVVQGIKAVSDWAKANPGKATVAVAILTTAAAMAGGPMGGAIAGFLARATKDLLQGEKLSTAVGKSIKTAAYGAIAGWALNGIGHWLEGMRANAVPYDKVPGLTQIDVNLRYSLEAPGFSLRQSLGSMIVPQDQAAEFTRLVGAARGGDTSAFKELWNFTKEFNVRDALANIQADQAAVKAIAIANDQFLQNLTMADKAISAIAQGTVQGKMSPSDIKVGGKELQPEQQGKTESKKLSSAQIDFMFEWCDGTPQVLNEGPLDALKKGAAAVGGAIKKGASTVGSALKTGATNLTTKVTADKLQSAWKKAGSPDDSDAIADILRKAGVSDDIIAPAYKQLKLPFKPAPAAAPAPASAGQPTAQSRQAAPANPASGQAAPAAASGGTSNAPKQSAAGQAAPAAQGLDFNGIQKAVAKLSQPDAKELVTYIDSLNKPAAAPAAPASGQTAPASGQAAPASGQAAPPAGQNKAAGDTYEKAKGDIRNIQSGAKPLPDKIAQGIQADLAKMAKGDKESGVFAADKIMKLAKLGMDVKDIQAKWIANSKAGERFLTQSQYFEITKMLREHNLRWSDLGLRVHLLEGTNSYFGISQI